MHDDLDLARDNNGPLKALGLSERTTVHGRASPEVDVVELPHEFPPKNNGETAVPAASDRDATATASAESQPSPDEELKKQVVHIGSARAFLDAAIAATCGDLERTLARGRLVEQRIVASAARKRARSARESYRGCDEEMRSRLAGDEFEAIKHDGKTYGALHLAMQRAVDALLEVAPPPVPGPCRNRASHAPDCEGRSFTCGRETQPREEIADTVTAEIPAATASAGGAA